MEHGNYNPECKINIRKLDKDYYILMYEHYTLLCSKDELLEELSEHMDNMTTIN